MAESTIRILIVEDYRPFRQFIRSTLPKEVGPQAIFEASDGVQATRTGTAKVMRHGIRLWRGQRRKLWRISENAENLERFKLCPLGWHFAYKEGGI